MVEKIRFFGLALLMAHAVWSADQIQVIAGGDFVTSGPDGTLYLQGQGTIDATPGAYRTSAAVYSEAILRRVDPASGRVIYATYLDFYPHAAFIDAQGAAYLYGISYDPQLSITPGAYDRHITGGEELVVAKLNPSGTAMEFLTILGGSGSAAYRFDGGISVGPDGAIYVVGSTGSKDFPTTPDAFQSGPHSAGYYYGSDAFFAALNADASQLVYSTYLGGSANSFGASVSYGDDAKIRIVGGTSALDFPRTTDIAFPGPAVQGFGIFVGEWDPSSHQFAGLAVFGSGLIPLRVAWNGKRAAIATTGVATLPQEYQPLWAVVPGSYGESILVFDTTSWRLIHSVSFPSASLGALALAPDGSLTLIGSGSGAIPASPGAHSLSGSNFVATIDAAGTHSLAATYFDLPVQSAVNSAAVTPAKVYVAVAQFGAANLKLYAPFPIIENPPLPGTCAMIYAMPNAVQQCGYVDNPHTTLYWDACDPQLDGAEVHGGTPDGPLLSSSTSGVLSIPCGNATYFLQDRKGRTLAKEQVLSYPSLRCSAVPNPLEQLTASPNPVLSCAEAPLTGTRTFLAGGAAGPNAVPSVEIHVGSPDGPKMAYTPGYYIYAVTGDWVRDGTPFFLTNTGLTPLAMDRVFLLPIRSCQSSAPPPAAIQAKPATITVCGPGTTLAWYSAGLHPVEIRESSATGQAVSRFDQTSGLFDVRPSVTTTYHLVGYSGGVWKDLAAETVTVNASGCHAASMPVNGGLPY